MSKLTLSLDSIPFNEDCIKIESGKIIVRKEKNSEYRASNPEQKTVYICQVDDCIVKDKTQRKCDYLLLLEDQAHFIELKGKNLNDAIDQLQQSVMQLMPTLENTVSTAFAKISLTRTPKIYNEHKWKTLKALMKKHNGDAFKSNSPFNDTL